MLVFVYSSYHLKLSKPNSLLSHNIKVWLYMFVLYSQNYAARIYGPTRNLQIVLNSQRIHALIKPSTKILAKFSFLKNSRN